MLVLVNINTDVGGFVTPIEAQSVPQGGKLMPAQVPHWVVVTGASSAGMVSVYNPFNNQTEYYTQEQFALAASPQATGAGAINLGFVSNKP